MNGMASTKLFIRLGNKLAPAMSKIGVAMQSGNKVAVMGAILEHLDPEEFERTARELLGNSSAVMPNGDVEQNVANRLGEIFQGEPFGLLELVAFGLEVNYGNFFDRLAKLGKAQASAMNPKI